MKATNVEAHDRIIRRTKSENLLRPFEHEEAPEVLEKQGFHNDKNCANCDELQPLKGVERRKRKNPHGKSPLALA
jgi:hypothetical protein